MTDTVTRVENAILRSLEQLSCYDHDLGPEHMPGNDEEAQVMLGDCLTYLEQQAKGWFETKRGS